MLLRLLLLAALIACGAEEEAAPTPAPAPVPEEPSEPLVEEIDDEEPDPEMPPSYSTMELDEMEPAELEQACFFGSQAACDRLGH